VSLVSRHLEAAGIATVVIGSALDVVERCGVARYLHTDFPLGNPCGKPYDKAMQLDIIRRATSLLESAKESRTTERTPYEWSNTDSWREAYLRVDDSNREQLKRAGEQRRQQQAEAKSRGETRAPLIDSHQS